MVNSLTDKDFVTKIGKACVNAVRERPRERKFHPRRCLNNDKRTRVKDERSVSPELTIGRVSDTYFPAISSGGDGTAEESGLQCRSQSINIYR